MEKRTGKARKFWLIGSIICTCAILFVFKYFNFFLGSFTDLAAFMGVNYPVKVWSIILPIGLSFHTFQSLSYVIEVYRGKQKAEKHFGIYALYVMFYPQLVAGPIERPQNMLHQFYEKHNFNYEDVVLGLKKILWGMFKKVVIADRLAVYVDTVYNSQTHHSGITLFIATIFFAFQIYCDFSGYSDIAIGTARVMGFKLMTNFNRPYLARSVSEFWKRWHISLSTWFKDYVYIPLGGNRGSKWRTSFNLLLTFSISGLWHGANWTYVVWGLLNGFYMVLGQRFKQGYQPLKIAITFILILSTWVFFRAGSLDEAMMIINKIFTNRGPLFLGDYRNIVYGSVFLIILLVTEIVEEYKLWGNVSFFASQNVLIRRGSYLAVLILIVLFGVFDSSQFIYFQF